MISIPQKIRFLNGRNPDTDGAADGIPIGKILFLLLCGTILLFAAYQLFLIFVRFPLSAPDYQVFSSAVQALNHLQDPYLPENLNLYRESGGQLLFIYPPHTLYFFWTLQYLFLFQNVQLYYAALVILLLVSSAMILTLDRRPQYIFYITLLGGCFISLYWNFTTGNKDIIFLFLFAILFTLLLREQFWQSSVVMGLTAGISLFATPFAAIFLVIRRPLLTRALCIALAIGVIGLLFLLSYIISPGLLYSYIDIIRGGTSPFYESGGWNIPTPYLLFGDLLGGVNESTLVPVLIVSCMYAGLIIAAAGKYCLHPQRDPLLMYSVVMLAVFMLLPRIKPYNFIILVIPLYLLFKDSGYGMKILVLSVTCLLPFVVFYLPLFSIRTQNLPLLLGSYVQTWALLLIFLVVLLDDFLKQRTDIAKK